MTFQIDLDGRARQVTVNRLSPGRYRVTVDDRTHLVDAARAGDFAWSLLMDGEPGTSREVQVAPGSARGEVLVGLEGRTAVVTIDGRRMRRGGYGALAQGEQTVVSPMPGRVLRVLVAPGEQVAARQAVVVVEAMKMENELRSPKPGRVKQVTAEVGASVEAGRVLVVIE